MAHEGYHEDPQELSAFTKDYHRMLESTIEELEAVDWYNQRAECATDPQAKAIMEHNRNEEIEHACMNLEWLRRNNATWDAMLREFLFQEGDIVEQEAQKTGDTTTSSPSTTLNIGNNKK